MWFSVTFLSWSVEIPLCVIGSIFSFFGAYIRIMHLYSEWMKEKEPFDAPLDYVHPPPKEIIHGPDGLKDAVSKCLIAIGVGCILAHIFLSVSR